MPNDVYPRAPVRFVSLIIGFPLSPTLQRLEGKEAVYTRVADNFPLLETISLPFQLGLGGGAFGQSPESAGPRQIRMMNRERTRSFTLGPRMLAFECTDHESFDVLREIVSPALRALLDVAAPAGLNGVTLKYVDEIRHPAVRDLRDWQGLIDEKLIGPFELLDSEPQQTGGLAVYRLSEQHELRIGYGAVPDGFVVDPSGPLKVDGHSDGPFFRLDLEGEWTAPAEGVPPLAVEHVLQLAAELHEPIHRAFESAITDQLRDHFRGHDGNHAQ
jgi:uncharacterized protein (TIGR04255 family)